MIGRLHHFHVFMTSQLRLFHAFHRKQWATEDIFVVPNQGKSEVFKNIIFTEVAWRIAKISTDLILVLLLLTRWTSAMNDVLGRIESSPIWINTYSAVIFTQFSEILSLKIIVLRMLDYHCWSRNIGGSGVNWNMNQNSADRLQRPKMAPGQVWQ